MEINYKQKLKIESIEPKQEFLKILNRFQKNDEIIIQLKNCLKEFKLA